MELDLSKKRHYTFPQAAFQLKCSEEDLRYFVIEGELIPSWYVEPMQYRQYQMAPHEDYGTTGNVYPSGMCDASGSDDVVQRGWLSGFHYLVLPNRTSGNQCDFLFAATMSSGFDLGDIIHELEASIGIDEVMNSGFFMAVELARFLAVQSKTKKSNEPDKALAARERTSFLNIIGALLAQLTAGKANDTTVITRAVTAYSAKQGISERKLQETFAAAKRSLGAS